MLAKLEPELVSYQAMSWRSIASRKSFLIRLIWLRAILLDKSMAKVMSTNMATEPTKLPTPKAIESSMMASLFSSFEAFVLRNELYYNKETRTCCPGTHSCRPPPNKASANVGEEVPTATVRSTSKDVNSP